ncbi:hypothetical protein H257_01263 [Aphanomyces astaci]|uniref:Uncharacterized protein n=1 Tax=Aphanomyces astaci TaxID=112090 RepID=W4H7F6_APHAT|nr:hypothetical protein H257_01263 [Aphanomyces astaci]ETV87822.1 hypothetical protein H257_01263 [Aphanomyces astaci]|eukprot:XP_009822685.1 hypothetical protein H257_01263 [Aphanomyces astaci]
MTTRLPDKAIASGTHQRMKQPLELTRCPHMTQLQLPGLCLDPTHISKSGHDCIAKAVTTDVTIHEYFRLQHREVAQTAPSLSEWICE